MSQSTEGNTKSFISAEALAIFRRVKINSSNQVVYADAGDDWIGITIDACASGDPIAVKLRTAAGTMKMVAAGALSINDIIYGAADGKVDDAPTGPAVGRALEAATADADVIEVLPITSVSQASASGGGIEVIGGAGDIAALDLVYVSDQTDAIMTVLPAVSSTGGRFADFICPNAITAAAKGVAVKQFLLQNINTSAGSVGDPVYLNDATAGEYDLTKPDGTDNVQIVGRIVEAHETTGAILFDLSAVQQIVPQTHVADPAACASMTQGAYTSSTSLTDPPTKAEAESELGLIDAELDKIKVDTAALKTAIDANNVVLDSILTTLEAAGLHKTS